LLSEGTNKKQDRNYSKRHKNLGNKYAFYLLRTDNYYSIDFVREYSFLSERTNQPKRLLKIKIKGSLQNASLQRGPASAICRVAIKK